MQNRSFEAAGIDAIQDGIARGARGSGQEDLVELLDAQLADEVQHVRYANDWIKRLVERGGRAGRRSSWCGRSPRPTRPCARWPATAMTTYPVAEDLRREAGFSEGEIETVRRVTAGR